MPVSIVPARSLTLPRPRLQEIVGEKGEERTVDSSGEIGRRTLYFRQCQDGVYTLTGQYTKVQMEECQDLRIIIKARVLSESLDAWKSKNIRIETETRLHTIQLDDSEDMSVIASESELLCMVIWVNTPRLSLQASPSAPMHETGSNFLAQVGQYKSALDHATNDWKDTLVPRIADGYPDIHGESME